MKRLTRGLGLTKGAGESRGGWFRAAPSGGESAGLRSAVRSVVQRAGLDPGIEHADLIIGQRREHVRSRIQHPGRCPLRLCVSADRLIYELAVNDAHLGIARDHTLALLVAHVAWLGILRDQIAPCPGLVHWIEVEAATRGVSRSGVALTRVSCRIHPAVGLDPGAAACHAARTGRAAGSTRTVSGNAS